MALAKKQIRGKFADEKYFGPEPQLQAGYSQSDLINAYNWYNYFYDHEKSKDFVLSYLKSIKIPKNLIAQVARVDKEQFGTLGWTCRMLENGSKLSEDLILRMNERINVLRSNVSVQGKILAQEEKDKEIPQGRSIEERTREKLSNVIGDFEQEIDSFMMNKYSSEFNPKAYLTTNDIKPGMSKAIAEFYGPLKSEFEQLLSRSDLELNGAYSFLTRTDTKKCLAFVNMIISECVLHSENVKKTRKPRKKKEKPAGQIVARLKYKPSDDKYNVQSIVPTTIVGAEQLWVFNTKTRFLGVYYAQGPSGLSVKGSTILGYDDKTSSGKKLRNPDIILPQVLQGGKLVLRKLLITVKSKEKSLNGRINSDTILLRTIR